VAPERAATGRPQASGTMSEVRIHVIGIEPGATALGARCRPATQAPGSLAKVVLPGPGKAR